MRRLWTTKKFFSVVTKYATIFIVCASAAIVTLVIDHIDMVTSFLLWIFIIINSHETIVCH